MAAVRILVVDDSAPWRWVVSAILQRSSRCEIIGEAFDGAQAVQKSIELQPDMVLLDIGLPQLNGLEAARQIRAALPNCKIILITDLIGTCSMSGIVGVDVQACLCKCELVNDLLSTIDRVLDGGKPSGGGCSFSRYTSGLEPLLQRIPNMLLN